MEYIKLLHNIIKEQNALLAQAADAIDALIKDKNDLKNIVINKVTSGHLDGEDKIKSLMVLKGVKQVDICRKLHVKPSTVSLIVSGKKRSDRIRRAIARALDMRVEDLWPNNHKRAA